ncbi:MAG: hypothetical protein ACOY5F_04735 [Pseudomonadota bacterium]
MADLSITAANVVPQAGATIDFSRKAGATVTAGQMVYLDPATNRWKLADADHATQAVQEAGGMAVCGAADGQPLAVLTAGDVALGSVLTAGARYYLSSTAGGIQPEADLSAGEEINLIGMAKSATVLAVRITRPGVTVPV